MSGREDDSQERNADWKAIAARYLDGLTNEQEQLELFDELQTNVALREWFASELHMHHELAWQFSRNAPFTPQELLKLGDSLMSKAAEPGFRKDEPMNPVSGRAADRSSKSRPSKFRRVWFALAGLAVAAMIAVFVWPRSATDVSIASVVRSVGIGQDITDIPMRLHQQQQLEFESGLAEISFDNGATILVRGPARMKIVDAKTIDMLFGEVSVNAGDCEGFVINTPDAKVTDLGTEFAVSVSRDGPSTVDVFSGVVDVALNKDESEEIRLVAGEAVRVEKDAAVATNGDPSRYLRNLHSAMRSFAAVEDTYAIGGRYCELNKGESDILLLKRDSLKQEFNRRAWVKFDLSGIPYRDIAAARLTLTVAPNDIAERRSPLTRNVDQKWSFDIEGMWDEFSEPWNETTLNWKNAPGHDADSLSGRMVGARAPLMLGTVEVNRHGEFGEKIVLEDPRLLELIHSDDDGIVTIIISRQTGFSWYGDLDYVVHSIASREHAELDGPMLDVWYSGEATDGK